LAVQRARQGDYHSAIATLERLSADEPSNVGAFHDLVIILGWAERDQEILSLADRIDTEKAPVEVLETVAKASRNLREFERSVRWYEHAISNSPARLDSHIGLAMVYADLGQPKQGLQTLLSVPSDTQHLPRVLMAKAYIHRSNEDFAPAIGAYDEILAVAPDHRDALRGKIHSLQRLLLPQQALDLVAMHPGILNEDELARLHTDWAAVQIRWANQATATHTETRHSLEQALDEIERTVSQFGDNESAKQRSRFDRIVALSSASRMIEAVAEFETLDARTTDIPVYVLSSAAGAYMHLKQPDKAQQLLLQAMQREPHSFALNRDMFYVYVDMERHSQAMRLAETMRQSQPAWHATPGSAVATINSRRLQAEIMAGLSLAFADQLPQAQAHFEGLLSQAPHNTDLRLELASVYSQRGWTDRAQFEYRQILAVEPDMSAASVGRAHALLDQRQFKLADDAIRQLVDDVPDRPDVMRLGQRWQQHSKNRFQIESGFGNSSGVQFGSEQYRIDASFFFKPIAYRWRPFVRTADSFAEFPEGDATRRRVAAGVEYRGVNWLGNFEVNADREGNNDSGVSAGVVWLPSDYWSLGASWETESDSVPLRGYRVGVNGKRVGVSVAYRSSESREISVSAGRLQLSDGNTRRSWLVLARQRVFTRSRYKLDLEAELFASNGSEQNVAYFSPRSDSSALITVVNQWRTYRRYGFVFAQQLNFGYGYYRQDSFGSSPIHSLNYIADLDINESLSFRLGLRRSRNVYDGSAESATFYSFDMRGAF
jgi:biofilm PGA synthesis protein PgaA